MEFSILIPAYKASFLEEAIESVLSQTYRDFEVIIVNDNSPENLDNIVLKHNNKKIRYYKNQNNCGAENVVDNWNICLNYADGDYIVCMGDDDKVKPNFLEEYHTMICKYPNHDVFHSRTELIDEESKVFKLCEERPENQSVYSMLYNRWKGCNQYIGDFLFKKDTLIKNGGFYKIPFALGSDDISVTILAGENGIININVPTFQYRSNRETISNSRDTKVRIYSVLLNEEWYNIFLKKRPKTVEDIKYWNYLKAYSEKRFTQHKYALITLSLTKDPLGNLLYWLTVKNDLRLSYGAILKALLLGVYCKLFQNKVRCAKTLLKACKIKILSVY